MSDLISKQEVKKILRTEWVKLFPIELDPYLSLAIEKIENIPSAEPKKGRWIFTRYYVWECSECGKNPTIGMGYVQRNSELFRYCPNCGASMEVRE